MFPYFCTKLKTFDVLIEIPRGSRNKYEYDFKIRRMRFDRMLFSSMMYPADYGFIPETLALDGDPLDVLVLINEPTFPGCVMEVKPIGVFHMADDKGSKCSKRFPIGRNSKHFFLRLTIIQLY